MLKRLIPIIIFLLAGLFWPKDVYADYSCTGIVDHQNNDWDPSVSCPQGFSGTHYNINNFSVAGTANVLAFDNWYHPDYGFATISATTVSVTGTLNAAGKGYPGGNTRINLGNGSGPGGGGGNGSGGGGGGHGNYGTTANGFGGVPYGSALMPQTLGSGAGGGGGSWDNSQGYGGAGGGAIQITSSGNMTVSGIISADGNKGVNYNTGGGAGGSIYLIASNFNGSGGTLTAKGGDRSDSWGGGGGGSGGRIAIKYASSYSAATTTSFVAGNPGSNSGTFVKIDSSSGNVYINDSQAWNVKPDGEGFSVTANDIILGPNVTLLIRGYYTNYYNGGGGITFNVRNFVIPATAMVAVDGTGLAGGVAGGNGLGPGGGQGGYIGWSTGRTGGGGGYGGYGAVSGSSWFSPGGSAGGAAYPAGGTDYPSMLGSGGGSGKDWGGGSYNNGGAGGGAVAINATGTVQVDGTISANGNNGGYYSGGGSGGSILIAARDFTGASSGIIRAKGGSGTGGGGTSGGGGGGGRIAIYYSNSSSWGGSALTAANAATAGTGGSGAQNGVVNFAKRTVASSSFPTHNSDYPCNGTVDHQQQDWDPSVSCPNGFSGTHYNIGNFSVAGTVTVNAYDNGVHPDYGKVSVAANNITVSGNVTANGAGYQGGGNKQGGGGPGGAFDNNQWGYYWGAGGGYGGQGSQGDGGYSIAGGPRYGSPYGFVLTDPTDIGSGGGGGTLGGYGGAGGGSIHLMGTGSVAINGTVSANGTNSTDCDWCGGGGSGGSIVIQGASLSGAGSIAANGGNGARAPAGGGGGGGGRVAVKYSVANNFTGTITAALGSGGSSGPQGNGGTFVIIDTANNDLYVPVSQIWKAGPFLEGSTFNYRNVVLQNNIVLSLRGYNSTNTDGVGQTFNLTGTLTVPAGSSLRADGGGYPGGIPKTSGGGPGGGYDSTANWGYHSGVGGAYGGAGSSGSNWGTNVTSPGGSPYGSLTNPLNLGSGGGGGHYGGAGTGGGSIRVIATQGITIDGSVTANGTDGANCSWCGGGGSGGTVYLSTPTLSGSGVIAANGGNGTIGGDGGGGGGRIALKYSASNLYTGVLTATLGSGGAGIMGDNGTVVVIDTTNNDLYINTSQVWRAQPTLEGPTFNYRNMTVQNNANLALKGYYTNNSDGIGQTFNLSGNLVVMSGSALSADGGGYAGGGVKQSGGGPGGGYDPNWWGNYWGNGGGYGGNGGKAATNQTPLGGNTYGSLENPANLGSGGGGGAGDNAGAGGGALRIIAGNSITINGAVTANGANAVNCNLCGGGGSGGSIFLQALVIGGTGSITARGGNGAGAPNGAGGGGGGRIAYYAYNTNNWAGSPLTQSNAVTNGSSGAALGTIIVGRGLCSGVYQCPSWGACTAGQLSRTCIDVGCPDHSKNFTMSCASAGIVQSQANIDSNYPTGKISQGGLTTISDLGFNLQTYSLPGTYLQNQNYNNFLDTTLKNAGLGAGAGAKALLESRTNCFNGVVDPVSVNFDFYCYGSSGDFTAKLTSAITAGNSSKTLVLYPRDYTGPVDIGSALTISSPRKILAFVNGSMTVSNNITVPSTASRSGIMFILNTPGDLTISDTVTTLDGVYLFPGTFSDGTTPTVLTGRGSLLSLSTDNMGFNRSTLTGPGEIWYYEPKYLSLFQNALALPKYTWSELPPQE